MTEMHGEGVVSRVATDSGGGIKMTFHIADMTAENFKELFLLQGRRVQLAVVTLPE